MRGPPTAAAMRSIQSLPLGAWPLEEISKVLCLLGPSYVLVQGGTP